MVPSAAIDCLLRRFVCAGAFVRPLPVICAGGESLSARKNRNPITINLAVLPVSVASQRRPNGTEDNFQTGREVTYRPRTHANDPDFSGAHRTIINSRRCRPPSLLVFSISQPKPEHNKK